MYNFIYPFFLFSAFLCMLLFSLPLVTRNVPQLYFPLEMRFNVNRLYVFYFCSIWIRRNTPTKWRDFSTRVRRDFTRTGKKNQLPLPFAYSPCRRASCRAESSTNRKKHVVYTCAIMFRYVSILRSWRFSLKSRQDFTHRCVRTLWNCTWNGYLLVLQATCQMKQSEIQ